VRIPGISYTAAIHEGNRESDGFTSSQPDVHQFITSFLNSAAAPLRHNPEI
jgi:hypothetical protein